MRHHHKDILDGVHVLLVEDDDDSREVLAAVLGYCGAVVTAAASAMDAVRLLARMTPAILVTDITMPQHDGFWLLETMRGLPHARDVPAIAVTGVYDAARVLAAGFDECVRKPVDPDRLCGVIRNAVSRAA